MTDIFALLQTSFVATEQLTREHPLREGEAHITLKPPMFRCHIPVELFACSSAYSAAQGQIMEHARLNEGKTHSHK
jgi:hypothetical protein